MTIDISKLDKAEVLAALYNASRPQGMGFLQAKPGDMTVEQARKELETGETYFDYLYGRVMKVDLSTNELHTRLYDRDLGQGAAAAALKPLFEQEESK